MKWVSVLPGDFPDWAWSKPAVGKNGKIYISCAYLTCHHPNNGAIEWKFGGDLFHFRAEPTLGPDGTIYFISTGHIFALNPGKTTVKRVRWKAKVGNSESSAAIGPDGQIYACLIEGPK